VSDRAGVADFHHVPAFPAYSGLRRRDLPAEAHSEQRRVATATLDELLADASPALVKIDVEGAEHLVLRGGRRALARARPIIVVEIGGAQSAYGTDPLDTHALLVEDLGLRVYDLDGRGPIAHAEFADILAAGSHWNFCARP